MTREKLIDKLRKIAALTKSSNEAEAANAAARMAQMMRDHQIEAVELEAEEHHAEELVDERVEDRETKRVAGWKKNLVSAVAIANHCELYLYGTTYRLFGRVSAVQTARYMYQYLCNEVNRLADEGWQVAYTTDLRQRSDGARSWKNAFRLGASLIIHARLKEQAVAAKAEEEAAAEQTDDHSRALIVLSRDALAQQSAWQQRSADFRPGRKTRPQVSSLAGYEAGKAAGANIALGTEGNQLRGRSRELKS